MVPHEAHVQPTLFGRDGQVDLEHICDVVGVAAVSYMQGLFSSREVEVLRQVNLVEDVDESGVRRDGQGCLTESRESRSRPWAKSG